MFGKTSFFFRRAVQNRLSRGTSRWLVACNVAAWSVRVRPPPHGCYESQCVQSMVHGCTTPARMICRMASVGLHVVLLQCSVLVRQSQETSPTCHSVTLKYVNSYSLQRGQESQASGYIVAVEMIGTLPSSEDSIWSSELPT